MKRVCFGLQVGSSVLSSYLDKIFHDIRFKYLINFCADVLIYSPDKESHLRHIQEVIKRLSDHKLTVNPAKVKFFCKEISFLGHLIKNNSVTIDPERTVNIKKYPVPKTVTQVKRFTGMCSYWSKYIPHFADICRPLHNLKKKGAKFKWTPECQEAFDTLKDKISNPPILQIADFNKPFTVQTDASKFGASGVMLQANDEGDLLPIAYYSKKFTDAEMKYSIYEKEAYSAILCIEKWHEFLELQPFKLITDNQALSYVLNTKRKLGRLARWVERLLNLPFTIEHCKSSENIADALSRLYEKEEENVNQEQEIEEPDELNKLVIQINEKEIVNSVNSSCKRNKVFEKTDKYFCGMISDIPMAFTDLKREQSEDPDCIEIFDSLKNKTNQECYFLKKDLLMYSNGKGKPRIYLPKRLINMLFTFYHNTIFGGHLGIARTLAKIEEYFYHPELKVIITEKVKTCKTCQQSKTAQRKYEGKLISIPDDTPMRTLFMDIVGPLPRSKKGNKYLLVVVDGFTKYLWLHALRECNSRSIIQKLQQIFTDFSTPRIIVSDNASYFISHEMKRFLFKNFIQLRNLASYRPCGNLTERFIRDITTLLRCYYSDNQVNWDQELGNVQICLNTARSSSTGATAFQLMFYHHCNNGLSNLWNVLDFTSTKLTVDQKKENIRRAVQNVKRSIQANRRRLKYKNPNSTHPFRLNDLVLCRTHFLSKKSENFSKKLAIKYKGPYRIIYFVTDVTVLIQNVDDIFEVKKVHIVDLKAFKK